MQTLQQRISKLWAAALNLEMAAQTALAHLPPDQKNDLEREIKKFQKIVSAIRKK